VSPRTTYLGLFQPPEGFEQVAQVTTDTIKILQEETKKCKYITAEHNLISTIYRKTDTQFVLCVCASLTGLYCKADT
jgi:hypothetical protein